MLNEEPKQARIDARLPVSVLNTIVDAKDEDAANFYLHHGFSRLPSQPLLLFATIDRKV